jgi:hypothetical protein
MRGWGAVGVVLLWQAPWRLPVSAVVRAQQPDVSVAVSQRHQLPDHQATPAVVRHLPNTDLDPDRTFGDKRPPPKSSSGSGMSSASASGGRGRPVHSHRSGVRPGNFVTLPNQPVDTSEIPMPYAGAIGRPENASQVEQTIVNAIKSRAIEPQVCGPGDAEYVAHQCSR